MKSAVENLTPTRVKLTVEVPAADLKPRLDAAYKSIGANVQIPGFRRGKVPARIIDQRFGRGAVVQEAVNDALPKFYQRAVEESELTLAYVYERLVAVQRTLEYLINRLDLEETDATI